MNHTFRTILLIVLMISLGLFSAATVHALTAQPPPGRNLTAQGEPPGGFSPEPQKDTCIHCHVSGSFSNIWVPTLRWLTFGSAGLLLLFGITRSASVWRTREAWKPLPQRAKAWIDERYQLSEFLEPILSKPVPEWQQRWWYCLGGLTFFFFVVQAVTGTMLAFYYKPTPQEAYASIQFIENEVLFGSAVRIIHHWSANAMIIMAFAHMARVFIMGAYKPPRELNWIAGVILLTATLAFGFTGYLLPWDQRAYWATTVGTDIAGAIPVIGELSLIFLRGGWNITAVTLSRFYALHIMILPLVTVLAMLMHFLMVRRQGIMKPL
jgi:hypothetical protein